ncbi:16S rRNA (guanine(966)-N(2))-methyltransferase RsmD [Chitinimonas sp.]|uniref:16S rRNA (guanine(966)-N(2))-methyltransferase RsmD n=1 Tax=Chitinimonas sp. TaxID=1934313 RepID=UPI0035B2C2FA
MTSSPQKSAKAGAGRNQLRIIGGEYRRRTLSFPDGDGLRPTPDRVRETLFNWLGQELHGQICLDLFAGAGGLGFEAASRGARRVVMVEQSRTALAALRSNKELLKAAAVDIVAADALAWLARNQTPFDLVLLDPPFASDLLGKSLAMLAPHLSATARVYIEGASWPELAGWEVLREGKAGAVRYGLLRRALAQD